MADEHASALVRMEESTEKMTDNLLDFYESRVPELANVRPDMAWDADFRKAGQCFLEGLNANGGAAAVSIYLGALETYATANFVNFADITSKMPPTLATNIVLELSQVCGLIALGSEKMAASGLSEAFAKEDFFARVTAPAEEP
jgi:hypothetical protein